MAGAHPDVAVFELDEDLGTVAFEGQPVAWPVDTVRVERYSGGVPERRTFTTRATDGLEIQVSWSPAMPPGRVWVECSYDPALFRLDRRDRWAEFVHWVATPGDWPCKYTPQLLSADKVYELATAAHTGQGFPMRVI